MKIRAYTLTVHAGHAPCWMHDNLQNCEVLSLANCKPPIRDVASVGEWIAGITPTRMEPRLAYLMRVVERLRRLDYWERYEQSRFDSIYKPKSDGGWIQLKNPWHFDAESFDTDLSSDWVLLSKTSYMFADSYSETNTTPSGLKLPPEYSALARGGMRGYGHIIEIDDSFLAWGQQQPRLRLSDFHVLGNGSQCGGANVKSLSKSSCE